MLSCWKDKRQLWQPKDQDNFQFIHAFFCYFQRLAASRLLRYLLFIYFQSALLLFSLFFSFSRRHDAWCDEWKSYDFVRKFMKIVSFYCLTLSWNVLEKKERQRKFLFLSNFIDCFTTFGITYVDDKIVSSDREHKKYLSI